MTTADYPQWICADCGVKHGKRPQGRLSCWHVGRCDICGAWTAVTEPRDFGHLRDGWSDGRWPEARRRLAQ